jgi:hypothetical protein
MGDWARNSVLPSEWFYPRIPAVMRLDKVILLLAVLVMPLQGVAASLSHLLCPSHAAIELTTLMHAGGQHGDDGGVAHGHGDSGSTSSDQVEHLSCHQSAIAIPSVELAVFTGVLPVFEQVIVVTPDPFFPEQPRRPPRS